jgi:O-antigen/teichoic acid export membrane protein
VLGPGLRLLVVVLLALGGLGVTFLAVGYVAAGALGILLYVGLVPGMLRRRGILDTLRAARPSVEFREILTYTLPLLTTDLVFVFMAAFDALLLGYFYGTEEVGALRVVESAARTNAIVALSFGVLFVPVATRYFARGENQAMNDLYWQAATWTAVLSFPVFALTFSLAGPITVLLYEERYASSAIFLALLALGRYVDAAFGLNGLALRVYGRMRAVIVVSLFAAAFHLAVSLVLIPPLGALGAAIAVAATYIAYNVVKQVALRRTTPIRGFDLRYRVVFGTIAAMAAGLALLQVAVQPPLVLTIAATGLAGLVVLFVARSSLGVSETFPELLRVPGMRFLLR